MIDDRVLRGRSEPKLFQKKKKKSISYLGIFEEDSGTELIS